MAKKVHQNKDIRNALETAQKEGFIWESPPGGSSHKKGVLKCAKKNSNGCKNNTCSMFVRSTPVNKEKAAQNIKRFMRKCGVELKKKKKKEEEAEKIKAQRRAAKQEKPL